VKYSRPAAMRVARRAHRHGVPLEIATYIALAAAKYEVPYAVAFAIFEQESNFEVVYGHDAGGLFAGRRVTKANYKRFREYVVSHMGVGANGVGLGQITYWTWIKLYVGLWKPRVQVYRSVEILAGLLARHSTFTALGAYNGGEGNPNETYAAEVSARADKWRPILAGKD
jgi:soluble lytic murein transglycosylase-like protein